MDVQADCPRGAVGNVTEDLVSAMGGKRTLNATRANERCSGKRAWRRYPLPTKTCPDVEHAILTGIRAQATQWSSHCDRTSHERQQYDAAVPDLEYPPEERRKGQN